jgi:hypothetical protein
LDRYEPIAESFGQRLIVTANIVCDRKRYIMTSPHQGSGERREWRDIALATPSLQTDSHTTLPELK